MPITAEHAGRRYPYGEAYEVSAAKIAEFAAAVGDTSAAYHGRHAVAPPTFAAVIAASAWESMFADSELDVALRRIVHADQRFVYHRSLRVGERVRSRLTIDKVRARGEVDIISCTVLVETDAGEAVCSASSTFYHSHPQPGVPA
jgi:hypothetical protein